MADYKVTITRPMTIYGVADPVTALRKALDFERNPSASQVRINALALRVDVIAWDGDDDA